jgi:ABC-type nitrate/sulfonate/bicarbonate transport system permease component
LLGLALCWEVAADIGLARAAVLPPLHVVVAHAFEMLGPRSTPPFALELDVVATLERLLGGFLLAALVGIPLGIAMAFQPLVRRLVMPVVSILLPIPALALVPILMLVTGLGDRTDYTIVFITAIIPIVTIVFNGVRAIPAVYFWSAASVGADAGHVFFNVTLPATVVPILTALRIGISYAWRSLIATEGITALTHGLGYTIFQANNFFDTPTVYVYVLTIAALGLAFEAVLMTGIERVTIVRWGLATGV